MSDNEITNGMVDGWWSASSDADYKTIYLYELVGGRESLLESLTVTRGEYPSLEDFKLLVKSIFGGGVYIAAERGANGTFAKRPQFAISGRPIRERTEDPAPVAQAESSMERLIGIVVQGQRESEARFTAALEKLAARPEVPQADPLDLFERAATILGKNGGAPVPQKSLPEQIAEMQAVHEFFAGLGGKEESGDMTLLFGELLGGIREVMSESEKTKRLQIAARTRARIGQQPAKPEGDQGQEKPPVEVGGSGMLSLLGLLDQLVEAAQSQSDVQDIAGQVWRSASKDKKAAANLKMLLEREDALEILAKANPKVGDHFDWFEELANAILDLMEGGGDGRTDADASAPAAQAAEAPKNPDAENSKRGKGGAANPPANARTRAARKSAAGGQSKSAKSGS